MTDERSHQVVGDFLQITDQLDVIAVAGDSSLWGGPVYRESEFEWLEIASAPKDGSHILIFVPEDPVYPTPAAIYTALWVEGLRWLTAQKEGGTAAKAPSSVE